MRIKVISLERSAERRQAFARHNPHLPFEFVPAVDGRAMSPEEVAKTGLFAPGLNYTPGAHGCALSHLRLWDECIASQTPMTIAEDDAIFRHDFLAQAESALARLPQDWDIVMWGWNLDFVLSLVFMPGVSSSITRFEQDRMREAIPRFQAMSDPPTLLRLDKCWGTCAYAISPTGAARFKAGCFPLKPFDLAVPVTGQVLHNTGIDSAMNRLYADMQAYVSFPPLVVTENDHTISTVQHVRRKSWLSRQWKQWKQSLRGRRG